MTFQSDTVLAADLTQHLEPDGPIGWLGELPGNYDLVVTVNARAQKNRLAASRALTTGAPASGLTPSNFAMHISPSWNYSLAFAQAGRDRHTEATRIDQAERRAGREHRRHVHDETDYGRG